MYRGIDMTLCTYRSDMLLMYREGEKREPSLLGGSTVRSNRIREFWCYAVRK